MKKRKIRGFRQRYVVIFTALLVMVCGIYPVTGSAEVKKTSKRFFYNQPIEEQLWNFDYMDVPEAWNLIDEIKPQNTRTEKDKIIVATIDTGADYQHPDLQENMDAQHCVSVTGPSTQYKQYEAPDYSHGTATAGVIAATSNNKIGAAGIAAGNNNDLISLMAINVFDREGYTSQKNASTKDIIKGINYACAQGARVINMSLGHTKGDRDIYGRLHRDKALKKAINKAVYQKNAVVVCSAGNTGDSRAWYPSDFKSVISVINTQKYTNAWSRRCKAPNSGYGPKKDLSAPGHFVYTTGPNGSYYSASGTSMAAPSVAAVAALMLYVNPNLKASEVKNLLCSTATDLYTPGYDIYTGYGNVNAYRAVAAAAGRIVKENTQALEAPKAKAESAGASSIKISWNSIPKGNGYAIYRATEKDGAYEKIKTIKKRSVSFWQDHKCSYNKNYYYKIQALGTSEDGKKVFSDFSSTAVSKPSGSRKVSALRCKSIDCQSIGLSWKKAEGAKGYIIQRKTVPAGTYKNVKTVKNVGITKWKDTDLKPGQTYSYRIYSYRSVKGKRYYSEAVLAKAHRAKPAKPGLTLKKKGTSVTLIWKKLPKVNGYQIYRSTGVSSRWKLIKTKKSTAGKHVNKGLKKGKKYRYKIRAYKKAGGKRVYSSYSSIKAKRI